MMEKLDPALTPASPTDLPRRYSSSSSSSQASSPDCASTGQHSPPPRNAVCHSAEDRGCVDTPPTLSPPTGSNPQRVGPEQAPADADEEQEQGGPTCAGAQRDASLAPSPPPPLLPAPAKTTPCPAPAPLPPSSALPPHIPVISLGHSKPPLPLSSTPLTALHPIPHLLQGPHGPHGDLNRTQLACLPVGHPGSSGGPAGPPAASPGPLFPQQYLAHPLFSR